jgi:hypothetical protein
MKKSLAVSIVAFCIALPGSFGAINDGLLAYYAFEGNALDGSGHGYHGSNYTGMWGMARVDLEWRHGSMHRVAYAYRRRDF